MEFKFNLDQKVKTKLGDLGIVKMIGIDYEGVAYYVQMSVTEQWWRENQLEGVIEKTTKKVAKKSTKKEVEKEVEKSVKK